MDTTGNEHIQYSRYWTQVILPLAYDDSLSYWETLARFNAKLNEVIDWANNYKDELKAYVDMKCLQNLTQMRNELEAYKNTVDAELAGMQNQLNQIIANVNQIIADFQAKIDKQIADFEKTLDDFQNDINQQIEDFTNQINTDIANFKTEITAQIEANEAWVKAQILAMQVELNSKLQIVYYQMQVNKEFGKMYTNTKIEQLIQDLPKYYPVPVVCPVNSKLMKLQECLNLMYETLRIGAISATQYDLLNLTADEYDNKKIYAIDYDLKAWLILGPYHYIHFVFSGISGEFVPIQWAIRELYQEARIAGITATGYDALDLSATGYDGLDLSAYDYSWKTFPEADLIYG